MSKPKKNGAHAEKNDPGETLRKAEEARALRITHISKLRAQETKKLAAKAAYDAEAAVLTDLFRVAKADTGYQRKEFQALLDDMRATRSDLAAAEERRATLRRDVDLPVGFQADLFETTPLEVQDEIHAKAAGYAAGLRGDACEMPETMQPRFASQFADGWGKGQDELSWALATVGKIVDRKANAGKDMMPAKPQGDASDDGDDDLTPSEAAFGPTEEERAFAEA